MCRVFGVYSQFGHDENIFNREMQYFPKLS